MSLSLAIKEKALEAGFDLAGVAPLAAWRDLEFSREWLERGYAGEMHYLENPKRQDPRLLLPAAKSVVCVGMLYNAPYPYSTDIQESGVRSQESGEQASSAGTDDGPRAWVSRYAWGRDYHDIMRKNLARLREAIQALAPTAETRVYVDTGPVVERAFARLSGIGWMGKNTCLINQKKGSWFFLGVILTSLELDPDLPSPDRCGYCTRCLEACPTGALVEPYVMDASRCIAYFTIELKGSIPETFRAAIGNHVFGCDLCQDVCPWNAPQRVPTTSLEEFQPMALDPPTNAQRRDQATLFHPPLEDLAALTKEDFQRAFARSPIKRPRYRGWLRNLCVAMGNSGDARFLPWLERVREHPDKVVREHADWALARLQRVA